jgi:hypothetical protein
MLSPRDVRCAGDVLPGHATAPSRFEASIFGVPTAPPPQEPHPGLDASAAPAPVLQPPNASSSAQGDELSAGMDSPLAAEELAPEMNTGGGASKPNLGGDLGRESVVVAQGEPHGSSMFALSVRAVHVARREVLCSGDATSAETFPSQSCMERVRTIGSSNRWWSSRLGDLVADDGSSDRAGGEDAVVQGRAAVNLTRLSERKAQILTT